MARSAGVEPTTDCLEGSCSIQLSYERYGCGRIAQSLTRAQDNDRKTGPPQLHGHTIRAATNYPGIIAASKPALKCMKVAAAPVVEFH